MSTYRLWVNEKRTVFVRQWESGNYEVAFRETPAHIWGPPEYLTEEKQASAGRSSREAAQATRERGY